MSWYRTLLCIIVTFVVMVEGSKLIKEHVNTYRTILESFGKNELDTEGIVQLMTLFDGNAKYNYAAVDFISKQIFGDHREINWGTFEELVEDIYSGQISDDPYEPQEIHLALGEDRTTMKVMWVTMESLLEPFVEFTDYDNDGWQEQVKSSPAVNYTYEVPQKWWPVFTGMIYEADMSGLSPSRHYKYRVGGYDVVNGTTRRSEEFEFFAAPATNPERDTRIATLADHGTFELLGFATVNHMVKLKEELGFELVFVAGDLSYAGLSTEMPRLNISKEDEFEHIWDLLGIQNQPIAARFPWMVGDGNHERFYNWTAFTNRYKMPQNGTLGSVGNFWYSFDYGNIHWVSASSEHPLDADSDQMRFLVNDLEAAVANRANVPWIVFSLHKPFYSSSDGSPSFAAELEPLLVQYNVDLTITGHMHCYERIHPVVAGEVVVWPEQVVLTPPAAPRTTNSASNQPKRAAAVDVYHLKEGTGPVHVVQGHAGGMQAERFDQPQPSWSAIRMANGFIPPNRTISSENTVKDNDSLFSDDSAFLAADIPQVGLVPKELQDKSINYTDTFGFGIIRALNSTHLYYSSVPDTTVNVAKDEFWIVRDRK